MQINIKGYFCIILTDKGEIKKESFPIGRLQNLKKHLQNLKSTLLFYFPQIEFENQTMSLDDLEIFFFYLGQFLSAHLPLKKSFENLQISSLSKQGQKTVKQLGKHIQDGNSLEAFFRERDVVKDPVILSTLLVAERMGRWDRIFNDLTEFIRDKKENQSKIRAVLMYPLLVIFALSMFMLFILPPIVSNMSQFFQDSAHEAPFIMKFASAIEKYSFSFLIILAVCGSFAVFFRKHLSKCIHFLLRKTVGIDFELEHFFYLLSFLLKQKIEFMNALSILAKENSFPSIPIAEIHKSLSRGENFSDVFTHPKRFPDFVISLIVLSQETSSLPENITRIHMILHKMHTRNIQKAIAILPNLLILLVGGIFIMLITTIFLPIYEQALHLSGDIK